MPIKWGKDVGKTGKVCKFVEVTVCVKGTRAHRRLSGDDATQKNAEALEKQLKQELFDSVVLGKKAPVPLLVAVDRYVQEFVYGKVTGKPLKSAGHIADLVVRLTPWLKGKTITDIVEVSRILTSDLLGRGLTPSTINSHLSPLRRTASLSFTRWDYLDVDIARKIAWVPGKTAKQVRLSIDEVWALIDVIEDQETKDFVLVSVLTGMRHEEMERLLAEDRIVGPSQAQRILEGYKVDFDEGVIIIPDQKNGDAQWHPLVSQAFEPIKRSFPLQYSRSMRDKLVRAALDKIGRRDCTLHTLRKSTGSILLDLGVDLHVIQKILRHKTIEVTAQSYAFMNMGTKRGALERLETALQRSPNR
jgi:integrase